MTNIKGHLLVGLTAFSLGLSSLLLVQSAHAQQDRTPAVNQKTLMDIVGYELRMTPIKATTMTADGDYVYVLTENGMFKVNKSKVPTRDSADLYNFLKVDKDGTMTPLSSDEFYKFTKERAKILEKYRNGGK